MDQRSPGARAMAHESSTERTPRQQPTATQESTSFSCTLPNLRHHGQLPEARRLWQEHLVRLL